MGQDTRKDPRAKVLSMTVRYKSATIDEFIEHHSHDVSRGGIFIKTPSPFPPGTLLKFEIRIQNEQAVLAGVGRVVWKRESSQSSGEQPAGMGVKFIKIDDKSKGLIARLIESQEGPSTYEAGKPADSSIPPEPAHVPAAAAAPTLGGVGPAGAAAAAAAAAAPRPATSSPPSAAATAQKRASTMLGLGAIGGSTAAALEALRREPAAAKAAEPAPAPRPAQKGEAGGFFPMTNPEAEMPPPEERTVMKQAAELLQQALAEAGGSLEEIGAPAKDETKPERSAPAPAAGARRRPRAGERARRARERRRGAGRQALAAAEARTPRTSTLPAPGAARPRCR
ncbi:MAG: TIGR02266 family protein [Polyangiaceae bacterium]